MSLTPAWIREKLEALFGAPPHRPHLDGLSELVLGILSQNTSDKNSRPAFQALRRRFPTWKAVARAPEADIAAAIRSGGLHRMKAGRIKEALERLHRERGGYSLDFLGDLPRKEALAWLQSLPGVGVKTARVVLLFSFGVPVFPVDTHIYRVAQRLGILDPRTSREEAHRVLEAFLPPQDYYPVHLLLIQLGRTICRARGPLHSRCPLAPECRYYQSTRKEAGHEGKPEGASLQASSSL